MTTPLPTDTNGNASMTNDDWDDGSIAVSADSYVNQLDEIMTPIDTIEEQEDEAVVADLSAFMEPLDEDITEEEISSEPILADLSMVMEPVTDESEDDIPAPSVVVPVGDAKETIMSTLNNALQSAPKPVQRTGFMDGMDESTYIPDEDKYADYYSEDVVQEEHLSIDVLSDVQEDLEDRASDASGRRTATDPVSYGTGDDPVPYVSPRAALSLKFRHYIETRWYPQWKYYDDRAIFNKRRHLTLQLSIALGAVAVPIIIGIAFIPTWIPAIISAMVAAFTAIENVMKYGDNWRAYRSAAEGLNHEKVLYEAMSGPYSRTNAPFRMFVERCEDVIAEETGRYFERNQEETSDAHFESDVSGTE